MTGTAKAKMMASWEPAHNNSMEKGFRRIIFLITAVPATSIFVLPVYKIRLLGRDREKRHLPVSPGASRREREKLRK